MSLFTSTKSKDFAEKVKGYKDLVKNENLKMEEIIKKKQYVDICSLKLDQSNHSYTEIANLLNVSILYLTSSFQYPISHGHNARRISISIQARLVS